MIKKKLILKNSNILVINFKLIIILINYIFIKIISKKLKLKVLLCAIARKENKYIQEFINFYKKLKFNKIILYDNNDILDHSLEIIIKKNIINKFVKLINYRGIKRPQIKAYNDCYTENNNNYDWIAFYDIDEYLYIKNYTNINKFLSLNRFNKCQSILINWKYYGDNNKLFYEKKPLKERFVVPFYFKKKKLNKIQKIFYSAVKSLVRGKLKLIWGKFPHYFKNTKNCRPDGTFIKNYLSSPQYSVAYIIHYITKSTEEFIERINRGDVYYKVNKNYINFRIKKYYFLFNKITNKKLNLFKKNFNFIKFKTSDNN